MQNPYIYRLTVFCLLMVSILSQMSFVRTSYTVSPNYAKSLSSLYTFDFNVYNPVAGTMNLRVDFPNNFVLSTANNCQVKLGSTILSGIECSLDSTTNEVVINNIIISANLSTIEVQFKTVTSKYSATSTLQFSFYNASNSAVITTNPELIQIENAVMTCSLTSTTAVVGAATNYTVQFQPTVQIQAGSVVQLQFDPWGPFLRSNFLTTNTTSVCGGQCTISLLPSFGVELMVFSSLFSIASNGSGSITLYSARNPASFAPIKLKIVISASDGSSVYMTGSTTFAASSTNTFNGVTFDLPVKTISSTNSNVNLRLTLKNPLNSNTYLRVISGSQISFSYTYAFNSLSTVPTEITGQPSGQLLLGNLARSTITSEPTLLSLGNFSVVNPPYSQKSVSLTFRTEQLINSTYYFIDQTTIQVTASASTITQAGVKAQVPNIGSTTQYDLWFVSVNRLISGSYIIITFPAEVSINTASSTCSLTTSGILSRCSITSSNAIRINMDSISNPSTNLTVSVSQVTNSFLTSPTNSFTIKAFYSDDLSLVDQLISGLSITATQVPLRAVTVTPTSIIVNAKTTYKFTIQTSYDIPTSSIFKIYFPPQLNDGAQTLASFSIDGTVVSGCLLTVSNSTYMQFSNLCIKSVVRNTSTVLIQLNNVLNPSSFKPTSSFTVEIWNGIYRQQYLNTGIIVTMTQTATIPYLKITPTSPTVNDNNFYTFEINFQIKRFSGDRVIVKFPTDVALSTVYECASLTTNLTISCSKINSQTLVFVLNFISPTYPSQSVKFTVQNFTNMWYTTTRTFYVQTTTNDTTYFYQEENSAVVSYQPAKIGATINNDNNVVLLGDSKITVNLVSPFVLSMATNTSQLFIVIQVPTDLVPYSGTCVPSLGSASCSQPSVQVLNISGISDFSSSLNIKFTAKTSFFESSSAFDIKLYYGSYLIQSNSELKASRYCQSPCKQCTATKTQCMSCLQYPYAAQNIYFSFNSSCVTACPDTYYLVTATNSCGRCSSTACLNCNNTATSCTSCPVNKYLFNATCLSVCPDGYYAFNNQCLVCSVPCATCTLAATNCLSCVPTYFLDNGSTNTSKCVKTCSNPSYLGIDGQCKLCTSNCKTCSISLSNCTSCDQTVYYFYNNSCIRNCPVGMYNNPNGVCTLCESPCSTCTTRVSCESCATNFYLFNVTNCLSRCPSGYVEQGVICVTCDPKCATCSKTTTNCTTCPSLTYFYQYNCLTNCPIGMYNNATGICSSCESPCLTCTTNLNCLTCAANFYMFNGSGCLSQCPNGYVGQINTCVNCDPKCKTCSNTTVNCTSCPTGSFFYQNNCLTNCPTGMYNGANGVCTACESPCKTCNTRLNCLSCENNFYLFNGTSCVTQCPNGFIQQVNNCVLCAQKCATCSVTAGNCTSCPSGSYFYQNDCFSTCPALTYPYNKTCTRCITPCVTCASSPEVCLTCIEGLLLLNSTCVTSCPLSGYIEEDKKCLQCPSNCLTCQTSINCSLCSNDYYLLQGGCVSSCPVNYPIISNRQCQACDSVCLTCQTTKQNCTSCKINLFKHSYTCLESCPIGYYSNIMTYECEDGLSTKIVFFPILILSIIIFSFVSVVKCIMPETSLSTSLTALLSLTEIAIWIFMIVQLSEPFKELNVDYTLPIVMNILALGTVVVQNVVFFVLELKRMEQDDFVRGWAINNVNYSVLTIHRYAGLVLNFKFFRLVYSRFFNIRTLSLPFKHTSNIFPVTTVFSILNFILSQIPMMVCSFSLAYKKLIKDQLFYTSIECLILTVTCAILLLIDIFKSEDYFEECEYVKTRKYLEKIKDASFNQLEDHLDVTQNQGSVEGEKYVSRTGGKFIFSKEEVGGSSLKELYFQEEVGSVMTDAMETLTGKGDGNNKDQNKKSKRINIFDPIKEEDEELYEDLKYSESQIKTQAQIQAQKSLLMDTHKDQSHALSYSQQKSRRLAQLGVNTEDFPQDDDNRSMIEQRPLKEKWNSIIGHRQKLARSIFNTMDEYSTKELEKIVEPIDEEDYQEEGQYQYGSGRREVEDPFRTTEYSKAKKTKRRKRKGQQQQPNNSELQKIYLQRLTQKKKYKDIFASSQSIKYDF